MAAMTQKPRDMFRWAFEEQRRTRISEGNYSREEYEQRIEAGAMDAFDYVWKRYGLDMLDIRPGRP